MDSGLSWQLAKAISGFFLYGFAKSERSNIDEDEEAALKAWAKTLLAMSEPSLAAAEDAGEVTKVDENA